MEQVRDAVERLEIDEKPKHIPEGDEHESRGNAPGYWSNIDDRP
jgi:hypothetical protein